MIRVTTLRAVNPPPPGTAPTAAINAMNELVTAARKVAGAGNVRWFFGNGGIVILGEPENYSVADKILSDPAMQVAVAKIFGLGFGIAEDLFLLEPERAAPFLPQQ